MKHSKPVSDNVDEYLEEMYRCEDERREVSTKGLANALEISMPSVSQMLRKLETRGLISYKPRSEIKLTSQGRKMGSAVYHKQETLRRFLISLGFGEKKAEMEACRLEHAVSDELEQALKRRLGI